MEDRFKPLDNEEVVSVDNNDKIISDSMFTSGQMVSAIEMISRNLPNANKDKIEKWFNEGIKGKTLKLGAKGWQQGKFRIKVTLEFCPDEPEIEETSASNEPEISQPESPLDDLRQRINQENQPENQ
ncbi:KGK domain-containing protein [Coleofasciculus sp. F4-SAH-05]|uniref:KGK domain-containing protein n=1 Tax=Coleofasciculus sp. F4-SAH-05 TaxID=3069525 RepID=UPI0032F15CDD